MRLWINVNILQNFADLAIVQHALAGIQIAVCVLILNAVIKLAKTGIKDKLGLLIFIVALILTYFSIVSTVWIVILAGAAGLLIQTIRIKKGDKS